MTIKCNVQTLIISWIKKKKTATKDTGTIEEIQILNTILGNSIHVKFPVCDNCS